MLLNIVFSYNRAMQLDRFLDSFIQHMKYPEYKIAIVYHTTGNHEMGYKKIIEKFESNEDIKFYERSPVKNYFFKIAPLLVYPRNLYRFIKYDFLRKIVDNFKFLVENTIEKSGCEFLMFSTDDTVYDADVYLDNNIFEMIREKRKHASYRLCLGKNINFGDLKNGHQQEELIHWNYYENKEIKNWDYPFIVDGTIYHCGTILSILKKILYHMPSTLESFVNTYVIKKKLFSSGMCPLISCLTNVWLNRVQTLGNHTSLNIDVDLLNQKYLEGYTIVYEYEKPVRDWGIIPDKVFLKKSNNKIILS